MSDATYLDLIEADRDETDDDTAAESRRRATLTLARAPLKGSTAMKRPPRYTSGPKKGQFKPRHAARAAAPRKRKRARAAAAAYAPKSHTRPRKSRRRARAAAAAPAHRRARRSTGRRSSPRGNTIIVAREAGMMSPRRRSPRRRGRFHARAPFVGTLGGMLTFGGGLIVGWEAADFIDRYVVTIAKDGKLPDKGYDTAAVKNVDDWNALAVAAKPNWMSVGFRLALAGAGIFVGIKAPWNIVKALGYGIGFGAFGHVGTQIVTHYIIEPMFAKTDTGKRLFAHENSAEAALNPAAKDGTQQGPPDEPRALPQGQGTRLYPHPLASMMGAPATSTPAGMAAAMAALATQRDPGFYAPPADAPGLSALAPGSTSFTAVAPPAVKVDTPAAPPAYAPPGKCTGGCGNNCDACKCKRMGDPPPPASNVRQFHPMMMKRDPPRRFNLGRATG